ncbi:isochorismatase family protein [Sphingomonas sp. ac-8]|uniref:isochorismatase family protein n=1 Tax=Sphingomonas sp. ac-8 TaxID=3242977 RepID=UPI003A80F00C
MTALARAVDPTDALVLFADLQPVLVRNSRTNTPAMIEAGAAALSEAAGLLGWPLLFSVVPEDGGSATPLPGLAPSATVERVFTRRCASPFGDDAFAAALEATGRRTIVLAAYSVEAVVQFAALDAIERGYRVVVALDACGARAARTETAALRRIERTGAIVTSVADILMTAAPDFNASPGQDVFAIVHRLMGMRIED